MAVFWDAAPCSLVETDRHFGGAYCLHYECDADATRILNLTNSFFFMFLFLSVFNPSHFHEVCGTYWQLILSVYVRNSVLPLHCRKSAKASRGGVYLSSVGFGSLLQNITYRPWFWQRKTFVRRLTAALVPEVWLLDVMYATFYNNHSSNTSSAFWMCQHIYTLVFNIRMHYVLLGVLYALTWAKHTLRASLYLFFAIFSRV
jgi:hypothetical protein